MVKTDASCRLTLAEIAPTLKAHSLWLNERASDGGALTGAGVLRTDSRLVTAGDIFLAYHGVTTDGHQHVPKAIAAGAALLVVEDESTIPPGASIPWIKVRSGRAAWSWLAAQGFGNPQRDLTFLGTTGTNGKSSTTWMIGDLLKGMGIPVMTLGTLGAYFDGEYVPTKHTTPDPDVLFGLLAQARDRGIRCVAMEVSSHAICQDKLLPLKFAGCAFTSFSRDHLDFHGTMDEYWAAKWRFFSELAAPSALRVFCDGLGRDLPLTTLSPGRELIYGLKARTRAASLKVDDYLELSCGKSEVSGSEIGVRTPQGLVEGFVPYFAQHQLENFGAALAMARLVAGRLPPPAVWKTMRPVPGRLEQVLPPSGRAGPQVVVDYAHTPDALEKTLLMLRPLCAGKLVVVFGCGGDRDRGKRPIMGAVAAKLADRVVVTSDNPRSEDAATIAQEIVAGMAGYLKATTILDRAAAIRAALADCTGEDLVLIAGKGHENYQIIGAETRAFDDRAMARDLLAS